MHLIATTSRLVWANMHLDLLGEQWSAYSSLHSSSVAVVGLGVRIGHIPALAGDSGVIGVSALVAVLVIRIMRRLHLRMRPHY